MNTIVETITQILKHRRMSARRRGIESAEREKRWAEFTTMVADRAALLVSAYRAEKRLNEARRADEERERSKPRVVRSPA